ncbi:hypothetical protein Pfo_017610 [Paulownia fortunei]|nr:hypothetical protein Pfo_017610 [Paulownia fortunei]
MATGTGSPCGACKFLRRKCAADCVFAPYFCSEQGPARFAAIHKVFGASNVSKLLLHVPVPERCEAVVTIAYEAQARIRDPVYGCVAHIFALQQQVKSLVLSSELYYFAAEIGTGGIPASSTDAGEGSAGTKPDRSVIKKCRKSMARQHGSRNGIIPPFPVPNYMNYANISPQSSLDSVEHHNDGINGMQEIQSRDEIVTYQPYSKKRPSQNDLSELQALALRMMKNEN